MIEFERPEAPTHLKNVGKIRQMPQLHEGHFGATSGGPKKDLAVDFSEVAQAL